MWMADGRWQIDVGANRRGQIDAGKSTRANRYGQIDTGVNTVSTTGRLSLRKKAAAVSRGDL
jgi:hypothetical protein